MPNKKKTVAKPQPVPNIYRRYQVEDYMQKAKGIDVSLYLRDVFMNQGGSNGSLITCYLGDDLDDNSPKAQKALHEEFGDELSVIYSW